MRTLISGAKATRHGRDPVEHIQDMAVRNKAIAESPLLGRELAEKFKLSKERVNQIRREHRNA